MNRVEVDGQQVLLVGRDLEIEKIDSFIKCSMGFQIVGPKGIGKSVLLHYAFKRATSEKFRSAFVKGSEATPPDVWNIILGQLGLSLDTDIEKSVESSKDSYFVFFDDFDSLIKQLAANDPLFLQLPKLINAGISFVATSQRPIEEDCQNLQMKALFRGEPKLYIGVLSKPEITKLVASSLFEGDTPDIGDQSLAAMAETSKGVPGVAKLLVERVASGHAEDVLERIDQGKNDARIKYPWMSKSLSDD